jgi:hypothetical protein
MADEAFALSPISARAALPSEEDYEAIREAFMETSRGRWFLGEYAKRNRNADTRMVLDAVERIEQSLADQKQPAPDNRLNEALAAIKSALDEARGTALAALDGLALEEHLAPVRKGARVIKEIAWRWREIGADGRICDLIDSQVHAIEGACGQLSSTEAKGALSAAFDLIERRIAGFGDGDGAPRAAEEAAASAAPAPAPSATAAPEATPPATAASDPPEAAIGTAEIPTEETVAQAAAAEMVAEAADVQPDIAEITEEAAEADDEAVLELVALEMAAPDDSDIELASGPDPDEIDAAALPPPEPIIVAREAEPQEAEPLEAELMAAPAQAEAMQAPLQPFLENAVAERPAAERPLESSLGSSLIASGIITKRAASVSDPLAPIRRMSQAEKIALFS